MDAKELRIGNYFQAWGKVVQVEGLTPTWIIYDKGTECYINNKEINPIPLTEEWLLKLGFEKNIGVFDNIYYSKKLNNDKYCDLSLISSNASCDLGVYLFPYDPYFVFESVHQLQNLYFALTGEGLTNKN